MRRSYDPSYGSRQQLKDCHEHGMKVARERDALKAENALNIAALMAAIRGQAELMDEIEQLKFDLKSAGRSVLRAEGQLGLMESKICPHCGAGVFE